MASTSEEFILEHDLFPGHYDEGNPLILPGTKTTKLKVEVEKIVKPKQRLRCLSKKQRKALEKIVKRRNDKKKRVGLLVELQKYSLPAEVYKSFTPLVQVQQLKKIRGKSKNKVDQDSDSQVFPDTNSTELGRPNSPIIVEDQSSSAIVLQTVVDVSSIESEKEFPQVPKSLKIDKRAPKIDRSDPILPSETSEIVKSQVAQNQIVSQKLNLPSVPKRIKEVELVRSKLPIIGEEQVIMEAIHENLVVVLAGETGSGKTTQVPQFLYEAGYTSNGKIIGITEPRRVAAIAMSQRVSYELNLSSDVVSYQIRFEGNASSTTKIKFMTDGVLLKEMEKDFLLSNYSVICIDEAHERSLYTDILIGLLSRTVLVRNKKQDPLRVIIMSATMRVEDFTKNSLLFKNSPALIHVPARQFPVVIHFNKVTIDNYLDSAKKKITKIHNNLPDGGILVFVTGQEEVKKLVKTLRRMFPTTESNKDLVEVEPVKKHAHAKREPSGIKTFDLSKVPAFPEKYEYDCEEGNDGDGSEEDEDIGVEEMKSSKPLVVIPLYSMLSIKEQEKIFAPLSPGSRVCIVATNVAETSLTIPGIRYVVDCGKVKLKRWDKITGVQKYEITWCSKASAQQRAGRAGRTGPGHCYRLFSSSIYESLFEEYSVPEIAVRPVDDMLLLMKSMSINQVRSFPYPTHPGNVQLEAAERLLILLGALALPVNSSSLGQNDDKSRITSLGKTMAYLPVSPRYSKMIALSFPNSIVEYVISLVAALSVQEVLLDPSNDLEYSDKQISWQQYRQKWCGTRHSLLLGDCMVLLRAVGAFEYEGGSFERALSLGVRYKSMLEIRKLRKKLTADINLVSSQEILLNPHMEPPTMEQSQLIRQVILSSCPDKIAKAVNSDELTGNMRKYINAYWCEELDKPAFIHHNSVLWGSHQEWIVFQESFEFNGKIYLKGICAIDPEWISKICPKLCNIGKVLKNPPPFYDSSTKKMKSFVSATFGKQAWQLPPMEIDD